jgi:hypothetical protein
VVSLNPNTSIKRCGRNLMNQKRMRILMSMVLILMVVFSPLAGATNGTNATPPGWVGEFNEWAGPKDMSQYNPVVPAVTARKIDEKTAQMYPGVRVIDPDITFPLVKSIVYSNASPITTVDFTAIDGREKPDADTMQEPGPDDADIMDESHRIYLLLSEIPETIQEFFKGMGI